MNRPTAASTTSAPGEAPSPSRRGDVAAVIAARPRVDVVDGVAGSTRAKSFTFRGSASVGKSARTSTAIPGAPATTRTENGRTADVSGVDGTAAPTTAAS